MFHTSALAARDLKKRTDDDMMLNDLVVNRYKN